MQQMYGLSDSEVLESRTKYGANIITPPKKDPLWLQYLEKFTDPLIIILLIAGALSIGISIYEFFFLDKNFSVFFEPLGIFIAIFLATGLAFYFEFKADNEFSILNKVNDDVLITVKRNGFIVQVPKRDIVVDDIVILHTGDKVPADGELLQAVSLNVDESSLTGESICFKSVDPKEFDNEATFPTNHVMRGTKIMEGHGVCKILAVGDKTENGKLLEASQIDSSVKTPLNEQLDWLSDIITKLSYGIAGLIIVAKMLLYFDWTIPALILLIGTLLSIASSIILSKLKSKHKGLVQGLIASTSLVAMGVAQYYSLLIVIPTLIFFLLVIYKFDDFSKIACISTIVGFFVSFIGVVLWLHFSLLPGDEISELLTYALETIMVAVTLIVVAVPEGLPMAVTLSLAYSMRRMLKTNNLVRKMHACETMGATTVICTDKTGTLTENKMKVQEIKIFCEGINDISSNKEVSSNCFENEADTLNQNLSGYVYEGIAVNSTANLDLSHKEPKVVGNPTEGALLLWLLDHKVDFVKYREQAKLIEELPFSTERKFMASTVISSVTGKKVLYVKGAPEIVLELCSKILGDETKENISSLLLSYQNRAMRTLGFAYQELDDNEEGIINGKIVAKNLTFVGVAAISDPVRESVPAAVAECLNAGIDVKIVTGDTVGTATEIGKQIGILTNEDTQYDKEVVITGPDFQTLSDEELKSRVEKLKIIARARPMDKKRLVEVLQNNNQVVAVTGDGTNDAPALKAAHVGLSMGDGTSVAKEASDITIIDNSFSSIGLAVMWGRSLFQNIQRFLMFQLTVNVSACLIVLAGAFMGTQSPLTVTQMLWINLIMDTFGAMALSSLPPSKNVMQDKPRDRKAFILNGGMTPNILGIGTIFFLLLFVLLYVFLHADVTCLRDLLSVHLGKANTVTPYEQTLLFSVFVWTHFWYMFNARGAFTGVSIFSTKMSAGFWTIATIIVVGQLLITEVGYEFFNVVPLLHNSTNAHSVEDFVLIFILSSVVVWVREFWILVKKMFTRGIFDKSYSKIS